MPGGGDTGFSLAGDEMTVDLATRRSEPPLTERPPGLLACCVDDHGNRVTGNIPATAP